MAYFKDLGTSYPYSIPRNVSSVTFLPADLDGDGCMEIASYHPGDSSLHILSYQQGNSGPQWVSAWVCGQSVAASPAGQTWTLQPGDSYFRIGLPSTISPPADRPDSLVVFRPSTAQLAVLQWNGRQMQTMFVSPAGSLITDLGLNSRDQFFGADIDGDGWDELVIFSPNDLWFFTLRWTGTTFAIVSAQQSTLGSWQMSSSDSYRAGCRLEVSGAEQIVAFNPSTPTVATLYLSGNELASGAILAGGFVPTNGNILMADLEGRGDRQALVYGNIGSGPYSVMYLQWRWYNQSFFNTSPPQSLQGTPTFLSPVNFTGSSPNYFFQFDSNASSVAVYAVPNFNSLQLKWSASGSIPGSIGLNSNDRFFVGDVDGDGRDELVMYSPDDQWLFTIKWDGTKLTGVTRAQYRLGPAPAQFQGVQVVNEQYGTLIGLFYEYQEAGGSANAVCGPDNSGQYENDYLSNRWNVSSVGFRQVILQENYYNCYVNWNGDNLALEDDNGNYFTSSSQALGMMVADEGGGQLTFNGGNIASGGDPYLDQATGNFDLYQVQYIGGGAGNASVFYVAGSSLPLLAISYSAVNADLQGADLSAYNQLFSLAGCNLSGAHLERADFRRLASKSLFFTDFTGAVLTGAKLDGMRVTGAIWTQATLSSTDLSTIDANAQNSDFSSAIMQGVTLSTTARPIDFTGSKFVQTNLEQAHLEGAILRGCDFTGASMTGAHLDGADLTGAILTGTDLGGATITGAILTGATLYGTKLVGIDLTTAAKVDTPAKFSHDPNNPVLLENCTVPFAMLGLDWSYMMMSGATITDIPQQLDGLNADYAVFPDALDLRSCSIRNATFIHAIMPDVQFGPRQNGSYQGANLEHAVMTNASMPGGRLQYANLLGADLTNANLEASSSRLTEGKPSVAVLDGAFLINATLDYVFANSASLANVVFLTYPPLGSTRATAYYARLNNAVLGGAMLYAADFSNAQLAGANMSGKSATGEPTTLVNAIFANANLGPTQGGGAITHLEQSDIRGTQFAIMGRHGPTDPANMDGCELANAIYSTDVAPYAAQFTDYYGKSWPIIDVYWPTVLGATNEETVCPDGNNGPCTLFTESAGGEAGDARRRLGAGR